MELIGHTRESLAAYTCAQVANLVPDGRHAALLPVVSRHMDEALARVGRCIDAVRMWRPGQFNYLHSSQYCQYLYYLSNTIWRNERTRRGLHQAVPAQQGAQRDRPVLRDRNARGVLHRSLRGHRAGQGHLRQLPRPVPELHGGQEPRRGAR